MKLDADHPPSADRETPPLSLDLMRGADAIRVFLFGDPADQKQVEADTRSVYHLATKGQLGLFKLGGLLCGRRSTILARIAEQERAPQTSGGSRRHPGARNRP